MNELFLPLCILFFYFSGERLDEICLIWFVARLVWGKHTTLVYNLKTQRGWYHGWKWTRKVFNMYKFCNLNLGLSLMSHAFACIQMLYIDIVIIVSSTRSVRYKSSRQSTSHDYFYVSREILSRRCSRRVSARSDSTFVFPSSETSNSLYGHLLSPWSVSIARKLCRASESKCHKCNLNYS